MTRAARFVSKGIRPTPTSASVQRRLQRQASRDTPIELAFRRLLHRRGLRFRIHDRPLLGLSRTADLVFRKARVAVYIDGCFWHGCPDHYMKPRSNADYWVPKIAGNRLRDADTDARLVSSGWIPFRVWEHDDLASAANRLAQLLDERLSRGIP